MGALVRALRRATGEPSSFRCRTDDLPAERGPDCGCGGAVVLGWFDEAPLVECPAVGEGAPVAETSEVERPDVHGLCGARTVPLFLTWASTRTARIR